MPIHSLILPLLAVLASVPGTALAGEEKTLSLPPASLAQWYKPVNKRQVWLHTMFRLRRSLQAVREYSDLGDQPRMAKWAQRLLRDYRKIGEMVPEWEDELDPRAAARLATAAAKGDFPLVARAGRKLARSCKSCHREYRALAAAFYRTPDYGKLRVTNGRTGHRIQFNEAMQQLSVAVNRIKIAAEDGRTRSALDAVKTLSDHLADLAETCGSCHRDTQPRERILGQDAARTLAELRTALQQRQEQAIGRTLGTAAVTVCARCHGIHRTLADLTAQIR